MTWRSSPAARLPVNLNIHCAGSRESGLPATSCIASGWVLKLYVYVGTLESGVAGLKLGSSLAATPQHLLG